MAGRICTIDGCGKALAARGWCAMHYARWKATGNPLQTPSGRIVREPNSKCAVEGCGQPRRKRDWCAAHYSQWKRKGEVQPFAYKWASDPVCIHCGADVKKGARQRYCSNRCKALFLSHDGERPRTVDCVRCGNQIDLMAKTRNGQFKRADTKTCEPCKRAKSLRHKTSVMEVANVHGTECGICGEAIDMLLEYPHPRSKSIDHVMPYALGGTHDMENLRLAHLRCNHVKSDRISYRAG